MLKTNYHTHTCFCDGKHSPEEVVKSAIEKGFSVIGFSGHSYTPGETYTMSAEGTIEYIREINRLKEVYSDKIKILCGIEADVRSVIDRENFDYVIGSAHDVYIDGKFYAVDGSPEGFDVAIRAFGGDVYALIENYYSIVKDVVKITKPDIIGHFDLVTKFNENERFFSESDERYQRPMLLALENLTKTKIPFEINTGAMARGWRSEPYPAVPIMERIFNMGGKFILNSDCHDKDKLDYGFEHVKNMPIYEKIKKSIICVI